MNVPQDRTNDTKTLLAVGALVVGGMIGLAVLAGLGPSSDAPPVEIATSERAPRALPAPVIPASLERPVVVEPAAEPVEPAAEAAAPVDPVHSGLANYRAGEWSAAASDFGTAVEARPQDGWTRYMLALSLWKSGQLEAAAAAMDQAARLDAQSIKPLVNLSRIENDRGEFDAALEAARAALAIEPDDGTALFLEGRSLRNLGMDAEAEASLRASVAVRPEGAYAKNLLGLLLIETDRPEQAIEPLRSAAELLPQVGYVHNNLGMALERAGRRDESVVAYARAVEADPGHARAAANLARLDATTTVDPSGSAPEQAQVAALAEATDLP